ESEPAAETDESVEGLVEVESEPAAETDESTEGLVDVESERFGESASDDDVEPVASPIRVSKGRRRRRGDGLPRGDVSVFRVEPTDEIEIVRVVDDDGDSAPVPLPETTATGSATEPAETPDVVIVSPSVIEHSSNATEATPTEAHDIEPVEPVAEVSDEPGPEPEPVVDVAEPDAEPEPEAVVDVTEPDAEPVISFRQPDEPSVEAADEPGTDAVVDVTEPDAEPVISFREPDEPSVEAADEPGTEAVVDVTDGPGSEAVVDVTDEPGPETVVNVTDGPGPEAVVDMAEPDADAEPEAVVDVTDEPSVEVTDEPGPEAVVDVTDGPEPETVVAEADEVDLRDDGGSSGGGSPPSRGPLLEPDDLPVRLSAGGPLDPQPGEYVLDARARTGAEVASTLVTERPATAEADTAAAEPATDTEGGPTFLDGIFSRLRAERTARTEAAREVLGTAPTTTEPADPAEAIEAVELGAERADAAVAEPGPPATDAAVAEPGPPAATADEADEAAVDPSVSALFARRNALLAEHGAELSSRLKRVLADQQNAVLDGLHHARTVDELAPSLGEAFRSAVVDELSAAATAGSTLVGEAFVVDVDHLALGLADQLTEPLLRRLRDATDDGSGVATRVRSIFREWRSERIAPLAEGFVAAALAQGALAGAAPDAAVRWHCDPGHRCAEGGDNELAGSVRRGDAFPTGHLLAPAYLGCRCFVVPVDEPT
ncbi:MAG: hypothetical protein AAFZ07_19065, partial [Actinomycetota bacterium]